MTSTDARGKNPWARHAGSFCKTRGRLLDVLAAVDVTKMLWRLGPLPLPIDIACSICQKFLAQLRQLFYNWPN